VLNSSAGPLEVHDDDLAIGNGAASASSGHVPGSSGHNVTEQRDVERFPKDAVDLPTFERA
jgi:hypothetical protein